MLGLFEVAATSHILQDLLDFIVLIGTVRLLPHGVTVFFLGAKCCTMILGLADCHRRASFPTC